MASGSVRSATITAGAVHYGPAGSSEGCLNNVGVNNSMAYSSTANQGRLECVCLCLKDFGLEVEGQFCGVFKRGNM